MTFILYILYIQSSVSKAVGVGGGGFLSFVSIRFKGATREQI